MFKFNMLTESSQKCNPEISHLRNNGGNSVPPPPNPKSTPYCSEHSQPLLNTCCAHRCWERVWGSQAWKSLVDFDARSRAPAVRHVSTFESTTCTYEPAVRYAVPRMCNCHQLHGFLPCTGSAVWKRAACRCTRPTNKHVLRSGTKPPQMLRVWIHQQPRRSPCVHI